MIEFGFSETCSKALNECVEIIKCQNKIGDPQYIFGNEKNITENSDVVKFNDLSIAKFSLNPSVNCCRFCNRFHPVNNVENYQIDRRLSLIDNINNKTSSSLKKNSSLSAIFRTPSFSLTQSDPIKNLIDSMKNFQSSAHNFENEIKKSCDSIRKKINNSVQNNLLKDLNENYTKLKKELDEYQQACVTNVDKTCQFWKDLENLIKANKLDCETIQFYLEQNDESTQSNESINNLIEDFSKLLDTKIKEFNSYILMDKKVQFKLNPEFKLEESSIGFLNYTDIQATLNPETKFYEPRINKFEHLNEMIEDQKAQISCISHLDLTNKIYIDENKFSYMSVFSLDSSDCILICNRYAKSNQPNEIYCDLFLVNQDGLIVKTVNLTNTFVRCVNTNSSNVLLTVENSQTEANKNFELHLYDSNLEFVKSVKVIDTNHLVETNVSFMFPVSVCLDNDKIFIFKNTIPFINVYDMNLNLLTIFGQDINQNYKYFIKRTHSFMCVKSTFLYTSQASEKGTIVNVLDLNTGLNLTETEIESSFSNFYVLNQTKQKNEIVFFCSSSKKLIVFDLKLKEKTFSTAINLKDTNMISSYCFAKNGFLASIMSNSARIFIF